MGTTSYPGRLKIEKLSQKDQTSASGEWNGSLTGVFLWYNVIINKAVLDVMTPNT